MTFNELMHIREYLVSANKRLIALDTECGINTIEQWDRFDNAWNIVKAFMDAHPELPYVC